MRRSSIPDGMRALVTFLWMSTLMVGQSQPDVTIVLQQGTKLVTAGQLAAAQDLYEKALLNSPQSSDLRFELGMVFFRQHNWPKAIENYRSSLSAKPGTIKPLYYLAESYFMESDLDRARDTIAQAAAIAPDDAQVCQKYGEYLSVTIETGKDGLSWLEKARRLNPGLPRIDFEIGKTQFALTDFLSAASTFEIALKKDPDNGEAAFLLAESRAKLGEWEKARASYTYAVTHAYVKGPAYYGLGRADVELGDFADAMEPLQRAIAVQPSLVQAHFQLAKAYRQLGRTKEARDETRLFNAMTDRVDTSELKSPEEEQAWKKVKPLLEANKEPEALQLLAKSSAADASGQGEPHYLLGTMYYSMGRSEDAKRVLILARAKGPQSARIAAYLGMVQLSAGEASAAESSFQAALGLNSAETLALIGMGGIRYQQQRWSDAIQYLEKSRTADPETLYLLCDSYYRVGKPEDALLTSEVIRSLGADRTQLINKLNQLVALHQSNHPRAAR
jgi:tetratricopeptide (TPR) repeat protein